MGNQLIADVNIAKYPTKILKIKFLDSGLDGSKEACLSYEPLSNQGHIWFVDKEKSRDCKGQWMLKNGENYLWEIKCLDGFKASGTLTNPLKCIGTGKGKDSNNKKVVFILYPEKE